MIGKWLRPLLLSGAYYLAGELIKKGDRGRGRVRHVVIGAAVMMLALAAGWVSLLMLVVSLFLSLAGLDTYLTPALITAGVTAALAALLAWRGWIVLKLGR